MAARDFLLSSPSNVATDSVVDIGSVPRPMSRQRSEVFIHGRSDGIASFGGSFRSMPMSPNRGFGFDFKPYAEPSFLAGSLASSPFGKASSALRDRGIGFSPPAAIEEFPKELKEAFKMMSPFQEARKPRGVGFPNPEDLSPFAVEMMRRMKHESEDESKPKDGRSVVPWSSIDEKNDDFDLFAECSEEKGDEEQIHAPPRVIRFLPKQPNKGKGKSFAALLDSVAQAPRQPKSSRIIFKEQNDDVRKAESAAAKAEAVAAKAEADVRAATAMLAKQKLMMQMESMKAELASKLQEQQIMTLHQDMIIKKQQIEADKLKKEVKTSLKRSAASSAFSAPSSTPFASSSAAAAPAAMSLSDMFDAPISAFGVDADDESDESIAISGGAGGERREGVHGVRAAYFSSDANKAWKDSAGGRVWSNSWKLLYTMNSSRPLSDEGKAWAVERRGGSHTNSKAWEMLWARGFDHIQYILSLASGGDEVEAIRVYSNMRLLRTADLQCRLSCSPEEPNAMPMVSTRKGRVLDPTRVRDENTLAAPKLTKGSTPGLPDTLQQAAELRRLLCDDTEFDVPSAEHILSRVTFFVKKLPAESLIVAGKNVGKWWREGKETAGFEQTRNTLIHVAKMLALYDTVLRKAPTAALRSGPLCGMIVKTWGPEWGQRVDPSKVAAAESESAAALHRAFYGSSSGSFAPKRVTAFSAYAAKRLIAPSASSSSDPRDLGSSSAASVPDYSSIFSIGSEGGAAKKIRLGTRLGAEELSDATDYAGVSTSSSGSATAAAAAGAAAAAEAAREAASTAAILESEKECNSAFDSFMSSVEEYDAACVASVDALNKLTAAQAHLDEVSGMGEQVDGWTVITEEESIATAAVFKASSAVEIKVFEAARSKKEMASSQLSIKLASEMSLRPHVKCLARFSSSTVTADMATIVMGAVDILLAKNIHIEHDASPMYHALVSSFVI